jgi:2'-5' RNA ligase
MSGILFDVAQAITAQAVNVNPDGTPHTGGMVALVPQADDLARLAVPGAEPKDQLHTTLYFLGDAADIPAEVRAGILAQVEEVAGRFPPVEGSAFAVNLFNPAGAEPAWVLGVGGDTLAPFRDAVSEAIALGAGGWAMPEQHSPWVPHVTIGYGAAVGDGMAEQLADRTGPVVFDRLRVAYGTQVRDFPLEGDPEALTAAAVVEEDGAMPYGIRAGGDDCPHEVYEIETGERAPGGCHATHDEALAHQRALEVNVPDAAVAPELAPQPGEHFHAIAHTEGQSTGWRTFTNLAWREPPFAFHWQKGSSAHSGTPLTLQVGLVSRVVRDPANPAAIHMFGPVDLDGADAREYARMLVAGFARWVSIGLDEEPPEVVEVWPDDADGEAPIDMLLGEPDQVLIDGGRIGELTGVSVPAQADAVIEPTPELVRALEALNGGLAAESETVPEMVCPDGKHWDPDSGTCVDDVPMDDMGTRPGGALVVAHNAGRIRVVRNPSRVPAAAQAATQAESEASVTTADVVQALTAAAYRIEIPDLPPASWYDEPNDVDVPGAFCVNDDGRVWGILAPLGTGHRAFVNSGRRVTAPHGRVDYSRFLGGEALTTSGRIGGVGPITMDCGHASRFRANGDEGFAHYENACTVVAKVRVGETAEGLPWVAGALEPGVTPDEVSRMLACRLSGDWQPHPDKPGWDELVAALLVPAPAFAGPRSGPTVTHREGVLVASSVPVSYVPHPEERAPVGPDDLEAVAASAGRTPWARRAARLNRTGVLR